jgi:hypothetical protein
MYPDNKNMQKVLNEKNTVIYIYGLNIFSERLIVKDLAKYSNPNIVM